ncbi:MAG TPA: hypothetical protein VLA46_08255 [Saprospiraceae bacterium]|nr:hypothetical protein [Saprospiraceae bacterium]
MKGSWFLVILVALFTGLVAYRAIVVPMTHDEASTWLNFRHYNLWSCISNYYCWQSANNHWLNTLLMQWSAGILGEGVFGLRLPNVIAGSLYFIAAALIVARYIHSSWLQIAGFLLLCVHVYLLDFFSLCRGYGLASSGVIWGTYTILRYSERFQFRWLVACVLILFLSVLGNFTAILSFLSMGLVWFAMVIIKKRYSLLIHHGSVWVLVSGLLAMLLAYPFRIFRSQGELEWGSKNLWTLSTDLASNLIYGFQYGVDNSAALLVYSFLILLCLIGLFALKTTSWNEQKAVLLTIGLLIINLLVIFLYHQVTGSSMPIGRKSVYLIPFLFAPLALALGFVKQKTASLLLGVFISGLLLIHSFHPQSWGAVREWYYDAYYPELFSTIMPTQPAGDSIRINSSWIFYPALAYYHQAVGFPFSGLAYQRPIVIDPTLDYYFIETTDSTGMRALGFVLEKKIGPYLLLKKMPPDGEK